MLTRLQDLLTAAAPLAGSFTPRDAAASLDMDAGDGRVQERIAHSVDEMLDHLTRWQIPLRRHHR